MKKIHIILLLLVIGGIVGMSFFIRDLTTQETFASAQRKAKFVVVKVKLDKSAPVEYDAVKNPNLTVFYAFDADGKRSRVMYTNSKPQDMERSEGIDLNGYMRNGYFECNKIQAKCPSKYKDESGKAKQNLPGGTSTQY